MWLDMLLFKIKVKINFFVPEGQFVLQRAVNKTRKTIILSHINSEKYTHQRGTKSRDSGYEVSGSWDK